MVRSELVEKISQVAQLTRLDAEKIVDTIFNGIKEGLIRGDRVELRGLGTFGVKIRAPRLARNLKTGESIPLPPRRVPFFRPGRELKLL